MKIQKRIAEFATKIVRKIIALYRPKNIDAPLVDDAHEVSSETHPIDDIQSTDPLNWETVARLIQNHTCLSNQYVWLTAKQLGMIWPDSLKFIQLKDLRDHSADELCGKLVSDINAEEERTVLATLEKVLFYWTKHTSESDIQKLSPENFVEETLEIHIDSTAAQVVFRRIDNQTLEEIGQSLGLTENGFVKLKKIHYGKLVNCLKSIISRCSCTPSGPTLNSSYWVNTAVPELLICQKTILKLNWFPCQSNVFMAHFQSTPRLILFAFAICSSEVEQTSTNWKWSSMPLKSG